MNEPVPNQSAKFVREIAKAWYVARRSWTSMFLLVLFSVGLLTSHILNAEHGLNWGELCQHILLTLIAVMAIHLLDRIYLHYDTEDGLVHLSQKFSENSQRNHEQTQQRLIELTERELGTVTEYIRDSSLSAKAMYIAGISRLYASRDEASEDILLRLRRVFQEIDEGSDTPTERQQEVRLQGISLNDFIQAQRNFGAAWPELKKRIQKASQKDARADGGNPPPPRLVFRILIIHPFCLGAELRSKGEARGTDAIESRLARDVEGVAKELSRMEEQSRSGPIRLDCRLYQIPPSCFMLWTKHDCFVEPYYFWNQRHHIDVPMAHFRHDDDSTDDRQLHDQLKNHFDWIWEHASIPVVDLLSRHIEGYERGMKQAGCINAFVDTQSAGERIRYLLSNAQKKVWLQGISLSSFFGHGPLATAISELISAANVDIRVMLISPDSEQARWRSFREHLFTYPDAKFSDYDENAHNESSLHRDTDRTIRNMQVLVSQIADMRRRDDPSWIPKIEARKYTTAPACFMLRVDNTVLVEQYHYGKADTGDNREIVPAILGKEMLVQEFIAEPDFLYDTTDDMKRRRPFYLMKDHFQFAFDHAEPIYLLANTPTGTS